MGRVEHGLENYLHKKVEEIGGYARKLVSPGHIGFPDQLVVYKGIQIYIEMKTEFGRLKPWQEREHQKMRSHGLKVEVLKNKQEIDEFINLFKFFGDSDAG